MKKILAYVMSALLLTACYDDSEMKSRLDKMDQRLTTVESQVASLNTQLTKLQGLMESCLSATLKIRRTELMSLPSWMFTEA